MAVVLKFGGSSLTEQGIYEIEKQILKYTNNNKKIYLVLSAVENTTNLLFESYKNKILSAQIFNIHTNLCKRLKICSEEIENKLEYLFNIDFDKTSESEFVSYGEILSTTIVYEYLKDLNIKSKLLSSKNYIFTTRTTKNNLHNKSLKDDKFIIIEEYTYCDEKLVLDTIDVDVSILQGFVCVNDDNEVVLMSRGGSDTTASIIAPVVKAEILEIFSDVNGIHSGDPRFIDNTVRIKEIDYGICQEMSAMGAKILHPQCVIPCQKNNIPIIIRNTYDPQEYTLVHNDYNYKNILAILNQSNVKLFHIESVNMWNDYGFVYDIFKIFNTYNIDVNIINTSQFIISTTTNETNNQKINNVINELKLRNYKVNIIHKCNIVSVIGYNITTNTDTIINVNKIMKNYDILLTHYSSNNMCMSFVIKEDPKQLLNNLHMELIQVENCKWWQNQINDIINITKKENLNSTYIYSKNKLINNCKKLNTKLKNVSKIFYAMKANNNLDVINTIISENINIECVSIEEISFIRNYHKYVEIMFTPNFCSSEDVRKALEYENINLVIDNKEILEENIDIFKNKKIGIRIDTGVGYGHHKKVITNGANTKFGLPIEEIEEMISLCESYNVQIVGLHCHGGSGSKNHLIWRNNYDNLYPLVKLCKNLEWINLGGGIDIDSNLCMINDTLKNLDKNIQIYVEPGRYIVANAGVLVSKVSQVRSKINNHFIGLHTGMNSLIRPTLYNAYHDIHNISKFNHKLERYYTVVGPICESGDVFGTNRLLPITNTNDYILIDNSGAYGHTMSSNYNMKEPATEIVI